METSKLVSWFSFLVKYLQGVSSVLGSKTWMLMNSYQISTESVAFPFTTVPVLFCDIEVL